MKRKMAIVLAATLILAILALSFVLSSSGEGIPTPPGALVKSDDRNLRGTGIDRHLVLDVPGWSVDQAFTFYAAELSRQGYRAIPELTSPTVHLSPPQKVFYAYGRTGNILVDVSAGGHGQPTQVDIKRTIYLPFRWPFVRHFGANASNPRGRRRHAERSVARDERSGVEARRATSRRASTAG